MVAYYDKDGKLYRPQEKPGDVYPIDVTIDGQDIDGIKGQSPFGGSLPGHTREYKNPGGPYMLRWDSGFGGWVEVYASVDASLPGESVECWWLDGNMNRIPGTTFRQKNEKGRQAPIDIDCRYTSAL